MSWTHDRLPEARADGLLTEQVGDELVVYDLESKDVHCLSPLAAAVYEHCDGRTDPARAAELATDRLGRAVTKDEVSAAVAQLEERALLASSPLVVVNDGISRRDLAKKSAKVGTAVASIPLITSIVAPTAAMAQSQIATGCQGCGMNNDCVSNHCCQSNAGKTCNEGCCVGANNSCHACPADCDVNPPCFCSVTAAEIGEQCPCICGAPGCVGPCCQLGSLCCTTEPICI